MLRAILDSFTWIGPGVAVGATLALIWLIVRLRRGRAQGVRWQDVLPESLLIGWIVCYLAATLSPPGYIGTGNLRRTRCFVHLEPILGGGIDRFANIAMEVPAGVLIVLSDGRRRGAWVVAAIAIPVLVEFIQWLVPQLVRTCHLMDVVDNYLGAVGGLVIGVVALVSWRWITSSDRTDIDSS